MARKIAAKRKRAGKALRISSEKLWAHMVFALGRLSRARLSPTAPARSFLDAAGKLKPEAARLLNDEFYRYGLRLDGKVVLSSPDLSGLAAEITAALERADTIVLVIRRRSGNRAVVAAAAAKTHRSDAEIWNALAGMLSPGDPDSVKATDLLSDYVTGGPGVFDAWFADLCRHSIFGTDGLYITSRSVKGKRTIEKIADAISNWYS